MVSLVHSHKSPNYIYILGFIPYNFILFRHISMIFPSIIGFTTLPMLASYVDVGPPPPPLHPADPGQ